MKDSIFILITVLRRVATLIGYLTLVFWTLGKFDAGDFIYYFRMG